MWWSNFVPQGILLCWMCSTKMIVLEIFDVRPATRSERFILIRVVNSHLSGWVRSKRLSDFSWEDRLKVFRSWLGEVQTPVAWHCVSGNLQDHPALLHVIHQIAWASSTPLSKWNKWTIGISAHFGSLSFPKSGAGVSDSSDIPLSRFGSVKEPQKNLPFGRSVTWNYFFTLNCYHSSHTKSYPPTWVNRTMWKALGIHNCVNFTELKLLLSRGIGVRPIGLCQRQWACRTAHGSDP